MGTAGVERSRKVVPAPGGTGGGPGGGDQVLLQRSLLAGKQVITRSTGVRLGVVTDAWVDTAGWEVVVLDLRPNAFFGEMDQILLKSLRQIGDVILVNDEGAVEPNLSMYGLDKVVGSDVATESGGYLGRVRDYIFNPDTGKVWKLVFDALGSAAVPSSIVSTYSLPVSEVVGVYPERIVVREGAQSKLQQMSTGILQRLTLYEPPWEEAYRQQYEMDYYGFADGQRQLQGQQSPPPRQYQGRVPYQDQDRRGPPHGAVSAYGVPNPPERVPRPSWDDVVEPEPPREVEVETAVPGLPTVDGEAGGPRPHEAGEAPLPGEGPGSDAWNSW